MAETSNLPAIIGMIVLTIAQGVVVHVKNKGSERRTADRQAERFDALGEKLDTYQRTTRRTLRRIDRRLTNVEHIQIGVDGRNGQRSKLEELTKRVDEIEGRDRERLERKAEQRGVAAPPGFSVSPVTVGSVQGGGA